MREGGGLGVEEMSSPSVVCGVAVSALASEDQEVGQTHFVPGFGDPQKRNWRGLRRRMATTKWRAKAKAECVESGLDSASQPPSVSSSRIKL